jgi:hypothetical protein
MSQYQQEIKITIGVDKTTEHFHSPSDIGNVSATLTADQILTGILTSAPTGPVTFTLPSAADLVSKFDKAKVVGYGVHLYVRNDGVALISLSAGSGGSISGMATVAASAYAAHYILRLTNVGPGVEAYQLIRV